MPPGIASGLRGWGATRYVIPAKAGIQSPGGLRLWLWAPAFAGVTDFHRRNWCNRATPESQSRFATFVMLDGL
jgi:hypothetical protein